MTSYQSALKQLKKQIDAEILVTEPDLLATYRSDWMVVGDDLDAPIAVARPASTRQVSEVLTACNEIGLGVVPQGGRTGLAGGAVPTAGTIVLSLEKMNHIEELDTASAVLVVEAGVTLKQAQEAALELDMQFGLDIGSRDSCTIGGNLSTNAGGNHVLKYGMARDLVLGLEVVLADGTVLSSMNTMLKNNAGYDLKHLFIGSEGTLGVITRAVLRLHESPPHRNSAMCISSDYPAVLAMLRNLRKSLGSELSTFEVMWPEFYKFASTVRGSSPLPMEDNFYLLIEQETPSDSRGPFETALGRGLEEGYLTNAVIAQSSKQTQEFWALRDSAGDLRHQFWPNANFDVSIPVGQIDQFVSDTRRRLRAKWDDVKLIVFGHVADGNIHLAVQVGREPFPQEEIDELVYSAVGTHNGSISAEHGIGTLKKSHLHLSRSPNEIMLMRQLKALLDPKNILNPGKIFDFLELHN